jgi:uncharacterized protein YjeT (DUF2065 family)
MNIDLDIISLVFFFISIVFIFEGIIYALFPDSLNSNSIRVIGFFFLFIGTITLFIII